MKTKLMSVLIVVSMSMSAFAQMPDMHIIRSMDNNASLKSDSADWRLQRDLKLIPLSKSNKDVNVSFGGEVRLQSRIFDELDFGQVPPGVEAKPNYLLQRYMFHADMQLGKHFSVFGQLTSNQMSGKDAAIPEIERNDLDLMQAFLDYCFHAGLDMQLRVGRQDLFYGMERMFGFREGPNVRLAYDGVKYSLLGKKFVGDFFVVRPVISNGGVFDDSRDKNELIFSTYWTFHLKNALDLDFYYVGTDRDVANYVNKYDDETRHSLGVRLSRMPSDFFYDVEFTYQFGEFGKEDIRAFQLAAEMGYRFSNIKMRPVFKLKEHILSGDEHQNDGKNNTFRAASAKDPATQLFTYGASNAVLLVPEVGITPAKGLSVMARYLWLWRYSENDGIYSPDMKTIVRNQIANNGSFEEKFYNQGVELEFNYRMNKHFQASMKAGYFFAEDYARSTGGSKNSKSLFTTLTYKF